VRASQSPSKGPPFVLLEQQLGTGVSGDLVERALTHRSYAYENGGLPTNERLEFLGDSVLGLVVTAALYRRHPDLPEGQLAKLRASVVSTRALADVARVIGLGDWVRLGKGEEATGGRDKSSILADTLEALLGAVYLDRGLPVAAEVVHRLFDPLMRAAAGQGAALDYKTALQELAAAQALGVPEYRTTESGPDHAKAFTAQALLAGQVHGHGTGRTKKDAEQLAARQAWLSFATPVVTAPDTVEEAAAVEAATVEALPRHPGGS
jgi:ribonuclease III